MRLREILTERILTLQTHAEKQKYVDQVWDVLQKSYASIGGFGTAADTSELINRFPLWKIVIRNGNITAVKVEKSQYGRKSVGVGTDGTSQGKKDIRMLIQTDISMKHTWAETSGKPESLYRKMGANPIPAKFAEFLTRHSILSIAPDGYHYTRLFNRTPYEKIIYGFADITADDIKALETYGIDVKQLQEGIRIK